MSVQMVFLSFLSCSLLSSLYTGSGTRQSLWGKMADFSGAGCSHWKLRSDVSVPALKELTVCLHVQFKEKPSSLWTAFMYRKGWRAELGLGGEHGHMVVWLSGVEWTTVTPVPLQAGRWHYICLSWSQTSEAPTLYVDQEVVGLREALPAGGASARSSSLPWIAASGTLTLGFSHVPRNGTQRADPVDRLSLFRLWGRERTAQEVTSQGCTEGDLVRWEEGHWNIPGCADLAETFLPCAWSVYEVRLRLVILRDDGSTTDLYKARDLTHSWLRDVLAPTVYLHRVSVSPPQGTLSEDSSEKMRWAGPYSRFQCLAHLNVIPGQDVATVQENIMKLLQPPYIKPGVLRILADHHSIYTTPIDSFPCGSATPDLPGTEVSTTSASTSKTTPSAAISTLTPSGPAPTSTTMPSSPAPAPSSPAPTPSSPAATPTATPSSPMSTSSTVDALTSTSTSAVPVPSSNVPSELYFDVQVNVSLAGVSNPEMFLHTWLRNTLPHDEMMVLNFEVLLKTNRDYNLHKTLPVSESVISRSRSRESCGFQVRAISSASSTMATEENLRHLLESPYNSSSVAIVTRDIHISRIYIVECEFSLDRNEKGQFRWPRTKAQCNASLPCPGNPQRQATRHCTHWSAPDVNQCLLVVETIPDLDHVDVTPENSMDVVALIKRLLSDHSKLTYQELATVLNKLRSVLNASAVTPELGLAVIAIISEILESDGELTPFTNVILNITEEVGDRMQGYNGSTSMLSPALALSVVDVPAGHFTSLTFGVSSPQGALDPEIHLNTVPFRGTVAFISLPPTLNGSFPEPDSCGPDPPRVIFQFFDSRQRLFKDPESTERRRILNTFVVAASVTNASRPITDLDQDVEVMLHHLVPNSLNKNVHCVYWNFNRNGGHGGWDREGCRTHSTTVDHTTCRCDHLTHFGVLMDVSRTELDPATEMLLTIVTYVGCGVSSLFLGVTVLTYTAFEKLRRDYPSQILINLSLALLALNLVFLLNSWLSSWGVRGLCLGVASAMHYFLLASFTWMGLEAVHMYLALVKVFNVYVPSYILKFCALGWGFPLAVCVLVLAVNRDAYGALLSTDSGTGVNMLGNNDFCWIQDDITFYVSVVGYAVTVLLFNTGVFVVVLVQIRHMRANRPAGINGGLLRDLKGVASITLLLGLTWITGFFTWGPARVPLLYLFSGLNSLQGLFIFIFHCLMKENVRRQWRVHLCFGCLRLEDYSEWSHTASVGAAGRPAPRPTAPLDHSFRSVKSNASDSTSASASSEQSDPSAPAPGPELLANVLAPPPPVVRAAHGLAAVPEGRAGTLSPPPQNS